MKKYKEELIKVISFMEIDLEPPYFENGEEEPNEIEFSNESIDSETESIKISSVICALKELSEMGATMVYISTDCDHHGYTFTGTKLTEM